MKYLVVLSFFFLATAARADQIFDINGVGNCLETVVEQTFTFSLTWDQTTQQVLAQSVTISPGPVTEMTFAGGEDGVFNWNGVLPASDNWQFNPSGGPGVLTLQFDEFDSFDAELRPFPTVGSFGDVNFAVNNVPSGLEGSAIVTLDPLSTPEPSTLLMLLSGMSLLSGSIACSLHKSCWLSAKSKWMT
jgi:hypothetical protein